MSANKKINSILSIKSIFEHLNFFSAVSEKLTSSRDNFSVKTLHGSAKSLFIAGVYDLISAPLIVVTENNQAAEDFFHDLKLLAETENISLLTEPKHGKFDKQSIAEDNFSWMLDGLNKAMAEGKSILIATPWIFDLQIPKPETIQNNKILVERGENYKFEDFTMQLMLNGFERETYVSEPGEISIRGGIVDIFPIGWDNPLRIEFWGDEVDSIREFDPLSQRSVKEHNKVEFIANLFTVRDDENLASIYDFLKPETLFIMDSPDVLEIASDRFAGSVKYRNVFINPLTHAEFELKSGVQPILNSSIQKFNEELVELATRGFTTFIAAESKIHLDRIKELVEHSIKPKEEDDSVTSLTPLSTDRILNSIVWLSDCLSSGFVLPEHSVAFFAEHQIFGRRRVQDKVKQKTPGMTLVELKQLNIGDLVVHEDKGIGRFQGFQTVELGGNKQDCMKIAFAEGDVLYVHLNYIHKVQKFSASEGAAPQLSKLGSTDWLRKRERTKKKLKDIARELIKLYAERKSQKGYSFPPDDIWQKEFEASFMYEDTLDQARTTEEVKKDMESDTPMDRLVCGDVGFGKTEIAVRAAFKAAQAGKQVAVLVPTTILAQQHAMSFKDRINRYPVSVDVISRFRTKAEQDKITDRLKSGALDILIGTHRLLSKDLKFKDLGLLIIDEEHRFGVGAKEKLRQLRSSVDTLTLTATPIPRTLNFSLMGARDLSLIETPPRNRLPVETEILQWDEDEIVGAIEKEIKRGGQVFFVSDRIEGLDKIAADLQMLMPHIRYGIGHGQMAPAELERIMEKFTTKRYDILFATKIVESGIDIPNANTILINNANNFGLAELYQLRGRVGRADQQGYCYLIIPAGKKMPTKALQRLQAIEEFTDLGSGLKLAMRDLEIRGSGNLLGPEQSGFINEIGFDLYQKVLAEAVKELRHDEFHEFFAQVEEEEEVAPMFKNDDISIETDADAFFPEDYIANDTDRFEYYKKLYDTNSNKDLDALIDEVKDRFGKLPREARELIFAVKLRIAALNTGFNKILVRHKKLIAEFPHSSNQEYYAFAFPTVAEYIDTLPNAQLKQTKTKLLLETSLRERAEAVEILWRIKKTIETLD